jgi:fructoselysine-6-phosphate deglycase
MLDLDENYYLKRGKKNYALRESVESIADEISKKGFKNIFFAGSGGSIAMLMPFAHIVKKLSQIPAYTDEAAELMVSDYKQLTEESLVVIVSKTGDAKEPVELAEYCNKRNIPTVAFVGANDTPLYNIAKYKVYIDEEVSAFRYIQIYFFIFRLLYNNHDFEDYNKFADEIAYLPQGLVNAIKKYDPMLEEFSKKYKDEPFQLWIGSGLNYGETFRFSACSLEEVFRIKTQAINSAEFFHGCFEIVDKDTCVILIKGEDGSRVLDERVENFLKKYAKKYTIIDTRDFELKGISKEYRKYFTTTIISILLGERLFKYLIKDTGKSHKTRRYYRKVQY